MWPHTITCPERGDSVDGAVGSRALRSQGTTNTSTALSKNPMPVSWITMTSRFICGLCQGASSPKPVVVNVWTTTSRDWYHGRGRSSHTLIPKLYAPVKSAVATISTSR